MITMALDPGVAKVGLSILDGEDLVYCNQLRFESKYEKAQEKMNDLTFKYYLEFVRLAHKYKITNVAWEQVPMTGGFANHDSVVSVCVALKILSVQYNLPWQHIPAITAKKMATGNHKSTKAQMRKRVLEIYPDFKERFPEVKYGMFDAYDSVLIGRAVMQKGDWQFPPTSAFTGRMW